MLIIDAVDIKILWVNSVHDGWALKAIVEWSNSKYVMIISEWDGADIPKYDLYSLSETEMNYEIERHNAFVRMVSYDYDYTGRNFPKPTNEVKKYFAQYPASEIKSIGNLIAMINGVPEIKFPRKR